ncbi:phosphotransferase family protein [Actinomycetospora sp.]|jgi:aminoglycoside phosphotransferase (APT) family kinase protein|uniref:phosphotransferase family protein n=1 Tax=Actinomycetospora sp. TaxID=1872135 RepID=UPI002F40C0DD
MSAPDDLAAGLAEVLGAGPVSGLRRLSAGASRETWAFAVDGRPLVLRRDPPGVPRPVEMVREAECLRAAARAGVPVPALVATGDGTDAVGSPYLVVAWVAGESLPTRVLRDERWAPARAGLARELGRVLAGIHAVDPAEVPALEELGDPLAALRTQHDGFGQARPSVEAVLRWLEAHRPPAAGPALVHGDFRHGNLLVAPDGLAAVLDWELAHLGDPREDLGWVCVRAWRFGAAPEVGGFGTRDELLAGYAEVAGEAPDPDAVRWWEIYGCVHWAVICRMQAERHLGGSEQSVEMATLGRRAVEAEYDALLALGWVDEADLEGFADPRAVAVADPAAERPTVDELLGAVVGFLSDELVPGDDRSRYLSRVARTALGVARRELGAAPDPRHRASLDVVGCADDAELAAALRRGTLDPDRPEVRTAVRSGTLARLAVANPRYPFIRP